MSFGFSRCGILILPIVILVAPAPSMSGSPIQPSQRSQNDGVVRLPPDDFPGLPDAVRDALNEMACEIPQPFTADSPENIINGHFTGESSSDWAVLCSRNGISSILVFQNGSRDSVTDLGQAADRDFLQVTVPGRVEYSRAIAIASPTYIREHYERYGGPEPSSLEHDGIDDIFLEKASLVRYYDSGNWIELTGTD